MFRFLLLALLSASSLSIAGELRVMCWNIHRGVGEDGKLDLERIAAVIRAQKPDLVALQEVDRGTRRSASTDQVAELAKLTGLTGVFGKAMDYDGGEYGQAILSKHPLGETKVHRLLGDGEPRIAFEAAVTVAGKRLRMVTVHLDHQQDARRLKQAQVVAGVLAGNDGSVILAGDFNDVPGSPVLKCFADHWRVVTKEGLAFTSPAGNPKAEIDHVLVRGLKVVSPVVVLPEAVASDHRPLVTVLEL